MVVQFHCDIVKDWRRQGLIVVEVVLHNPTLGQVRCKQSCNSLGDEVDSVGHSI
jgi:hypothetical protein